MDLEKPTPLFPFGGNKFIFMIFFNSTSFFILGIIIPSTPASKTCLQISIFLFGSLTSEAFLLISATRNKFGKSLISNKPCSKSNVKQSKFLSHKISAKLGLEI